MMSREKPRAPAGVTSSEFWDRIWRTATRGLLVYVTGSIIVVGVLLAGVVTFVEDSSSLAFRISEALAEQTSVLSKHELEVCNEWVVVVERGDTYEQARDRASLFKEAYDDSGHGLWSNEILVVRDPENTNRWLVVVDFWPGRSTEQEVAGGIRHLNIHVDDSIGSDRRALQDTLEMWLRDTNPYEYRMDRFAETYGRIVNLEACPTDAE
jgi:hypothetical protein